MDNDFGKLQWRCRRGMKELDFLLRALPARALRPGAQATNAPPSPSFSNCPTRTSRVICSREMSRPDPRQRRAVPAASCDRIDLIPSFCAASGLVRVAGAGLRGHVVRRGAAVACASRHLRCRRRGRTTCALRAFVLLRGPRAVRAIEWTEAGELIVCLGAPLARHRGHARERIVPAGPAILGFALRNAGGTAVRAGGGGGRRRRVPSGASAGVSTGTCAGVPGAPGAPLLPSGPRFEVRHAPLKIIRLARARKETFAGVQGLFSSKGAGVLL